jgi:hypothetical protein
MRPTNSNILNKGFTSFILVALLSFVSAQAFATSQYMFADALLDVNSGKLIKSPLIEINDGKIVSITATTKGKLPEGTLDLSGHTLLPGFMDMHVHLTSDAEAHGYKRLSSSLPRATLTGVKHARDTLIAGFTTVRNVGAPGFADVALLAVTATITCYPLNTMRLPAVLLTVHGKSGQKCVKTSNTALPQ